MRQPTSNSYAESLLGRGISLSSASRDAQGEKDHLINLIKQLPPIRPEMKEVGLRVYKYPLNSLNTLFKEGESAGVLNSLALLLVSKVQIKRVYGMVFHQLQFLESVNKARNIKRRQT